MKAQRKIQKKKVKPTFTHQDNIKQPLNSSQKETFSPSSGNYFFVVVTIMAIIFVSSLMIQNITMLAEMYNASSLGVILMIVFFVVLPGHFIWQLNSFCIEQDFLHVQKKAFGVKRSFAWKEIKSMAIERRSDENQSYRVLVIKKHSNKKHTFRFPISKESRHTFIKRVRERNIPIEDKTSNRNFGKS